MNLPNKLTLFRVVLIPFFVFFLLAPYFEGYGNYIAVAIFIVEVLRIFLMEKSPENIILSRISENLWIPSQINFLYALH